MSSNLRVYLKGGDAHLSGQSIEPVSLGESLEGEVSQMQDTENQNNVNNTTEEIAPVVQNISAASRSWVSFGGSVGCSVQRWAEMSLEERADLRKELMDF
jgi:hypothetical protein